MGYYGLIILWPYDPMVVVHPCEALQPLVSPAAQQEAQREVDGFEARISDFAWQKNPPWKIMENHMKIWKIAWKNIERLKSQNLTKHDNDNDDNDDPWSGESKIGFFLLLKISKK